MSVNLTPTIHPISIDCALRNQGFVDGDWPAYLGYTSPEQLRINTPSHCTYYTRFREEQHQHVWVCTNPYDNSRLTAIVFLVYAVRFNGRAKGSNRRELEERGGAPRYANGAHSLEELLPWLDRRYDPPEEDEAKKKKS